MTDPRPTYGITRIDQPEKKNHGFYVRITHRGKSHQKYFPDKSLGGKPKALKAAKLYRDALLEKMPKYKQDAACKKKRRINHSGVVGVTHVVSKSTKDKVYEYWQAAWLDKHRHRIAQHELQTFVASRVHRQLVDDHAVGLLHSSRTAGWRAQANDSYQLPVTSSQLQHGRADDQTTRGREFILAALLRPAVHPHLGIDCLVFGVAEPQTFSALTGRQRKGNWRDLQSAG